MEHYILCINSGSSSMKLAMYLLPVLSCYSSALRNHRFILLLTYRTTSIVNYKFIHNDSNK